MDEVIISSPLLTQHIEHLKEVFRLLQVLGLTLNKEECKFGCDELKYLVLIIYKEIIKKDETEVRAIVEMKPSQNSKELSKFLGMSQWYAKFIKNYADRCEPLNDWVLIATHYLSSATKKVVAKFEPKFEGLYRVLEVKNNNVVI
ncbi:hypothetical protein TNCV_2444391 [Trichonephila clavipes]|nr:hypothetical protein TNCV_2444391 [Trichonephila clavipes]